MGSSTTSRSPGALDLDSDKDTLPPVGMTRSGTVVGAAVRRADGTPALVVWNGQSGGRLRVFEGKCCAVAFSPDGAIVASGNDRGGIVVTSLATGQSEAKLTMGPNKVNAIAFGRNPRIGQDGPDPLPACRRWQLAAADVGGRIHVWDLRPVVPYERTIFPNAGWYQVLVSGFFARWQPARLQFALPHIAHGLGHGPAALAPQGRIVPVRACFRAGWSSPGRGVRVNFPGYDQRHDSGAST